MPVIFIVLLGLHSLLFWGKKWDYKGPLHLNKEKNGPSTFLL